MKGKKILLKEDRFHQGQIDVDGVDLPESNTVPLVWGYDFDAPPFGYVENIRVEDEELLGDVRLREGNSVINEEDLEGLFEDEWARLGGYYNNIIVQNDIVVACTLRAVSVILLQFGANPGAKIHDPS